MPVVEFDGLVEENDSDPCVVEVTSQLLDSGGSIGSTNGGSF
jgi:hypothetical protein